MNTMIPNEAVEAALSKFPMELRLYFGRVEMRAALEAAAPYIAAQTLTNAANAYPLETAYGGAEHAINWLRERAKDLEAPASAGASLIQGEK